MNKSLAYIIGVFLGDGTIANDKRTFVLQVIDKDFAENTVNCLKILSENHVRMLEVPRKTKAGNSVYAVYLSDVNFCRKLEELTHGRKNLPIDFSSWDRVLQWELIAGLLDSEGYVSMSKIHTYNNQLVFNMAIGIGATDVWIYELHRFLQEKGIQVGTITREKLKSGKIFAKFTFNKKSFINNNLYFKTFRKQQRIKNYKILFPGSTTKRSIPITEFTKEKISIFSKTRKRIDGKFIKIGNDIV